MPNLRGSQAVIVCEGTDDYDFARGYLKKLGVKRFYPRVNPKGKGAGNAWVLEQFAKELKAHRAKRNNMDLVLVTLTDGDGKTPAQQKQCLESSKHMKAHDQRPRQNGERAVIVVPMRHIESWFEFVVSGSCNETVSYKNKYRDAKKPTKWGEELAERCRSAGPSTVSTWPSALQDACQELTRL